MKNLVDKIWWQCPFNNGNQSHKPEILEAGAVLPGEGVGAVLPAVQHKLTYKIQYTEYSI